MPKTKSSRAARKRFKVTGTGKVMRYRGFKSHILTKKHPKRKRRLRQPTTVVGRIARRIRQLVLQ
jgi:large subunit ribosomal protein L35